MPPEAPPGPVRPRQRLRRRGLRPTFAAAGSRAARSPRVHAPGGPHRRLLARHRRGPRALSRRLRVHRRGADDGLTGAVSSRMRSPARWRRLDRRSPARARRRRSALKPPPSLGTKCGVFPRPGDGCRRRRRLARRPARLEPGHLRRAGATRSSDAIIDYINADGGTELHPDFGSPREYGIPYRWSARSAKRTKVKFTAYGDESDKGQYRVPLKLPGRGRRERRRRPPRARLRQGAAASSTSSTAPSRTSSRSAGTPTAGVIWDLRSPACAPRATPPPTPPACRSSPAWSATTRSQPGEHRPRDPGHLRRHPRRLDPPGLTLRRLDRPTPNAPPMGMRLRMKAGYDISGLTGAARVIADALKHYGMIVADNGSNWFFPGSSDQRWNDDNLNQLKQIPGSAFEVVRSQAEVHAC